MRCSSLAQKQIFLQRFTHRLRTCPHFLISSKFNTILISIKTTHSKHWDIRRWEDKNLAMWFSSIILRYCPGCGVGNRGVSQWYHLSEVLMASLRILATRLEKGPRQIINHNTPDIVSPRMLLRSICGLLKI